MSEPTRTAEEIAREIAPDWLAKTVLWGDDLLTGLRKRVAAAITAERQQHVAALATAREETEALKADMESLHNSLNKTEQEVELQVSLRLQAEPRIWEEGRKAGLVEATRRADAWSKPDHIRLAAGEMTAQELRTAQAVAGGVAAAIRALSSGQPAPAEGAQGQVPAAEGWRFDMENAPKDGRLIVVPGGVAYWKPEPADITGRDEGGRWYTVTGEPFPGLPIEWNVDRWLPIPPYPMERGDRWAMPS